MKLEIILPDNLSVVRVEAVPNSDLERRLEIVEKLRQLDELDIRTIKDDVRQLTKEDADIRAEIAGGPWRNNA